MSRQFSSFRSLQLFDRGLDFRSAGVPSIDFSWVSWMAFGAKNFRGEMTILYLSVRALAIGDE